MEETKYYNTPLLNHPTVIHLDGHIIFVTPRNYTTIINASSTSIPFNSVQGGTEVLVDSIVHQNGNGEGGGEFVTLSAIDVKHNIPNPNVIEEFVDSLPETAVIENDPLAPTISIQSTQEEELNQAENVKEEIENVDINSFISMSSSAQIDVVEGSGAMTNCETEEAAKPVQVEVNQAGAEDVAKNVELASTSKEVGMLNRKLLIVPAEESGDKTQEIFDSQKQKLGKRRAENYHNEVTRAKIARMKMSEGRAKKSKEKAKCSLQDLVKDEDCVLPCRPDWEQWKSRKEEILEYLEEDAETLRWKLVATLLARKSPNVRWVDSQTFQIIDRINLFSEIKAIFNIDIAERNRRNAVCEKVHCHGVTKPRTANPGVFKFSFPHLPFNNLTWLEFRKIFDW